MSFLNFKFIYKQFNRNKLFLTDTIGEKTTKHIVIGTPKEIAIGRIMGLFDMTKIDLVAIDDADIVTTTNLIKTNILMPLPPGCQIIMFSSTHNVASLQHVRWDVKQIVHRNQLCPQNIKQFFVKCKGDCEKLFAVQMIFKTIYRSENNRDKIIVFCNVS